MRRESTRDYLDLLLSCKHWPAVLAVDMACDVVACQRPELAQSLWGERRGCFERPVANEVPKVSRL